jgi:hypothetical protein
MSPKLKNIKKGFIVDIPRPRKIDHPLIESITKEIVAESEDLFSTATANTANADSKELGEHILSSSSTVEPSFTIPIGGIQ